MSSVETDPRIGNELAGYRIERLLGRGGMGVVYLARDPRLDRPVALKLLAPALAEDAEFRARFLRESKLAASLDHQNVVPIYEAGETDGTLFIAMRYVEGTDLRELLHQAGRLPAERTIQLLAQVASALDAAHEHGLVHRDVKPGNILIAPDEHVYLGDFGLTRRAEDPDAGPAAGNSLGTVDYVAPEQIEGDPVDGRADVYSLGCVLYHCLTGRPPFTGSSPMGVLWDHLQAQPPSANEAGLPDGFDPVLTRALAKSQDERQPTCRLLIDDAGAALGLTKRPRRRLVIALSAIAIAAVAVAIAIPLSSSKGDTARTRATTPDTKPTLAITADSVQHIDPTTNTLLSTTRIGGKISQIATGEGAVWASYQVWKADFIVDSGVYRIAPATGASTGKATGVWATEIAVGLGNVWVVNNAYNDGTLSRIDPGTMEAQGISLSLKSARSSGGGPIAVGKSVWVVATACLQGGVPHCVSDNSVWAIGGKCDVGAPCYVKTEFEPISVRAIAADNGTLWLSGYVAVNLGAGKLERVDEATHRFEGSTPLDFLPAGGLAAGDGAVWIADPVGGKVVRIDAATRRVVARVPVGHGPAGVAVGAGGVWVTNYDDGTVSRIDPATNRVVATIEVGPHPDHIAAGLGGVWVAVHAL